MRRKRPPLKIPDVQGKCGLCPFNNVCGGCRARAYAMTGDYLESDPCCIFQPDAAERPNEESFAQPAPVP